jgi:hypothetical protein
MSPISHLLIAWIIAHIFFLDYRERRLCLIAGVIPDIDGVFILFSQDLFIKLHHTLGHWLIFGIPLAFLFSVFSKKKLKSFGAYSLAFSFHLIADIMGSDWSVYPFGPFSEIGYSAYPTLSVESIFYVINPTVFIIVLVISLFILFKYRRTPIEFISKRWDSLVSNFLVLPFTKKCGFCEKKAFFVCEECEKPICSGHSGEDLSLICKECRKKSQENPKSL